MSSSSGGGLRLRREDKAPAPKPAPPDDGLMPSLPAPPPAPPPVPDPAPARVAAPPPAAGRRRVWPAVTLCILVALGLLGGGGYLALRKAPSLLGGAALSLLTGGGGAEVSAEQAAVMEQMAASLQAGAAPEALPPEEGKSFFSFGRGREKVEPADWPRIELTGLVGGETKRAAILNGEPVPLRADIQGVKVVGIGNDGAWLEFKGQRQFLYIGDSTP